MARVLIVDDNEEVCRCIKAVLEDAGHVVHSAQAVEAGIAALRGSAEPRPYEVALIDLRFENFGETDADKARAGMKVVEAALKVPFLEPIMLTAYPSHATAAEALAQGIFRYLTKSGESASALEGAPGFMETLVNAVQLAVDNRTVMKTLAECLAEARRCFQSIESEISNKALVDEVWNCITTAEKAHSIILRARGRNPASSS